MRDGFKTFGLLLNWDAEGFRQTKQNLELCSVRIVGGGKWSVPKPTGSFINYCVLVCKADEYTFGLLQEVNKLIEANPIPDLPGIPIYAGAGD